MRFARSLCLYEEALEDLVSELDIRSKREWKIGQIDEGIFVIEAGFDRRSGRVEFAFLVPNPIGIRGVLGLMEVPLMILILH